MPPETIADRYRVEREVGRGGMGSVWLCRDTVLDRAVALKQVGLQPGESAPDLQRALREARSSAALSHRNVVSIYDAIEEGDHIWLVMEYVPGRTLKELMAEEGPLSPARVAWIGAQVAEGLAAAHDRGTVHRDVKPGNVLVTDSDDAKIADFGIARTSGDQTLTQTGLVYGTPTYFSPQLARGEDPTAADDVWALGATLYAAVEGEPPYPTQRNAIATLSAIASGPPPSPQRAEFLAGPIERMLEVDPETRWSMGQVAETLKRLHRSHDPEGTLSAAALGATATLPSTGAAADTEPAPEPEPEPQPLPVTPVAPPPEAAPERDRRGGVLAVLGVLLLAAVVLGGYLLLSGGDDSGQEPSAADSPSTSAPSTEEEPSPEESSPDDAEATPEPEPEPEPEPAPSGDRAAFVSDYYGVLPQDTETAWSRLSPGFQEEVGSYDDYVGFWSTIDAVRVESSEETGDEAVEVTLTYTTDGATEREVRLIEVEEEDGSLLISGDEVVG